MQNNTESNSNAVTEATPETRPARIKQLAQTVMETAETSFHGVGLQAYAQAQFSAACTRAEDGTLPDLTVSHTKLARSGAGFSVSLILTARHRILSACKRYFADEAYAWEPDQEESRTYEEVSALLEENIRRFADNLAEGSVRLVSQDLSGTRAFFDTAFPALGPDTLLGRLSETVWDQVGDPLNAQVCAAMLENHGRRQRHFRNLPAGAARTGIAAVSLAPAYGETHGKPWMGLQLEVKLDCGLSGVKQEPFDPLSLFLVPDGAPALPEDTMKARLCQAYATAADKLTAWACGRAPLAVLRDFDGPGCPPEALRQLLRDGEAPFGSISLRWAGPKLEQGRQICCLPEKGGIRYVLMDSFSPLARRDTLPYSSSAWAYGMPLALETLSTLPDDLATVLRLSSALDAILREAAAQSQEDVPAVSLTVKPDLHLTLESSRLSMDLSAEMATRTGDLEGYFRELAQILLKEQHLCRTVSNQQMKVLRTLNPTELAVLRYVWTNKRTWYTDAADQLDGTVLTQKSYMDVCLNKLLRTELPTADALSAPLLASEYHRNEHHMLYRIYTPNARLDPDILEAVQPRDFTFQELPMLKPACRELWAADQLIHADTPEARKQVLLAVQLQMPRTFLARFAHTPEGQTFFRSFEGDDALQAQLTVQHLPGCRKLAETIWPKLAV